MNYLKIDRPWIVLLLLVTCPLLSYGGTLTITEKITYTDYQGNSKEGTYSITYTTDDDTKTASVTGFQTSVEYYNDGVIDLIIPSKICDNGIDYLVTSIADGDQNKGVFATQSAIGSITLPSQLTKIGSSAFWDCRYLKHVHMGNVTTIGDRAFQYCSGLVDISLPNTLQSVGDHFLCHCNSLQSLVLPKGLKRIGTYFLHGCSSLRDVYLLSDDVPTLGKYPFMSQSQQGDAQVSNCTFHVSSSAVYEKYKNADGWKLVDASNTDYVSDDGTYRNDGNKFAWGATPEIIKYAYKWITVCLPVKANAKAIFGDNCKIAKMTGAKYDGIKNGRYSYYIDFTQLESDANGELIMEANVPYMVKADQNMIGSAYIVEKAENWDWSKTSDEDNALTLQISNQAEDPSAKETTQIKMLGTYNETNGHTLTDGEYLFYNPSDADGNYDTNMMFVMKEPGSSSIRRVNAYHCYWQIIKDGKKSENSRLGTWIDETTSGIGTIEKAQQPKHSHGVYTLSGEKVFDETDHIEQLPKGIYIVGGKKIIVK